MILWQQEPQDSPVTMATSTMTSCEWSTYSTCFLGTYQGFDRFFCYNCTDKNRSKMLTVYLYLIYIVFGFREMPLQVMAACGSIITGWPLTSRLCERGLLDYIAVRTRALIIDRGSNPRPSSSRALVRRGNWFDHLVVSYGAFISRN